MDGLIGTLCYNLKPENKLLPQKFNQIRSKISKLRYIFRFRNHLKCLAYIRLHNLPSNYSIISNVVSIHTFSVKYISSTTFKPTHITMKKEIPSSCFDFSSTNNQQTFI